MLKNKKIESIFNKYSTKIINNIYHNMDTIKEVFYEYYGVEYKELIDRKLDNTYFVTYSSNRYLEDIKSIIITKFEEIINSIINSSVISVKIDDKLDISDIYNMFYRFDYKIVLSKLLTENCIPKKKQTEIIIDFAKYRKSIESEEIKDYLLLYKYFNNPSNNRIFSKTFKFGPHNISLIDSYLNKCNGVEFNYLENNEKEVSYVFFLLFVNDNVIIHELNHVITNNILVLNYGETKYTPIEKNGLNVSGGARNNEDIIFEELINDKSAREIQKKLLKKGVIVSQVKFGINKGYCDYFPLINLFYEKYKKEIIISRMTENTNYIYSKIDKEKFIEFKRLVRQIYLNSNGYINSNDIKKVEKLVIDMDNKNDKKEEKISISDDINLRILNEKLFYNEFEYGEEENKKSR